MIGEDGSDKLPVVLVLAFNERLEDLHGAPAQRHFSIAAVLCIAGQCESQLEVDVAGNELQQFATPHRRLECEDDGGFDEGIFIFPGHSQNAPLFARCQAPDARGFNVCL